jgi:hypothetical protein
MIAETNLTAGGATGFTSVEAARLDSEPLG